MTPLRVMSVSAGQDTGGQGVRMAQAFHRYAPDWTFDSFVHSPTYINYPVDQPWRQDVMRQTWEAADVAHLHNGFRAARLLEKHVGQKPTVLHYHGTVFRSNPSPLLMEQKRRGSVGLTSTLDLWLIAPKELEWLPAPYNLAELAALRTEHQRPDDGRVRIAHAPTNRAVKSTERFIEATQRLVAEGYSVDVDLIEYRPWAECLQRKAAADIFFDQAILGYGCNALEAWGMGLPVVAGAADATLDEYERRFGYLPFYHATHDTIYEALRELVELAPLRERYGQIGQRYVTEYHDDAKVVERLKVIYHRALEQHQEKAA